MEYRTKRWIRYWFKAGYRKGHGIHSPFLYHLISAVIWNDGFFSAYPKIESAELFLNKLLSSERDSQLKKNRRTDLPVSLGKLVFRLVNEFQPGRIFSYGPTNGINLLFLSLADSRIKVFARDTDITNKPVCYKLLNRFGMNNVLIGDTIFSGQSNFKLVNLPDNPCRVKEIFADQIVNHGDDDVLIVRGIHQSAEMESVWCDFIKKEEVRVSLDLFEIGIVLMRPMLQKEDFILRF